MSTPKEVVIAGLQADLRERIAEWQKLRTRLLKKQAEFDDFTKRIVDLDALIAEAEKELISTNQRMVVQ